MARPANTYRGAKRNELRKITFGFKAWRNRNDKRVGVVRPRLSAPAISFWHGAFPR